MPENHTIAQNVLEKFLEENGAKPKGVRGNQVAWKKGNQIISYKNESRIDIDILYRIAEQVDCSEHDLDQFMGYNRIE
ncbi:MAG: hypothetical protein BRD50_07585 [Bacteroidetes bacterium SW_11_45_7]|nr:MAG: hypothetical protein BRD50_07585 [Bacteroidetes bacterium SW_11_45_7]